MLENDGEKREFQTPGTFKLLDWDSKYELLRIGALIETETQDI
jgi:hypothetical protein